MTDPEQNSPAVSPAQASAAGLLVVFLMFALVIGGFIAFGRYWPAIKALTPAPSADLDKSAK